MSDPICEQLTLERRELHRVAEPGWCEIYTATKVVRVLYEAGWEVTFGRQVVCMDGRMGLPSQDKFDFFYRRALDLGADEFIASKMRDGFTGIVATLGSGGRGPVIAFRFDLDANDGAETASEHHRPAREGFASSSPRSNHNCGHDGHTAIGLGLGRQLAGLKSQIGGEIRLIFQPAEEGLRGARAMIQANVLDGVDYFVGCHIGIQARSVGEIVSGYRDILGSVKWDVSFEGTAAHAAVSPHEGRNALLAACTAASGLMAIPRHGSGDTRINIGTMAGGDSRNTVPSEAKLAMEIRADTSEALNYLEDAATRVIAGAADMHGVRYQTKLVGAANAASSDAAMAKLVREAALQTPGVTNVRDDVSFRGSDDASAMMAAIENQGGKAVYLGIGADLTAPHHNPSFDFSEDALPIGVSLLLRIAIMLSSSDPNQIEVLNLNRDSNY